MDKKNTYSKTEINENHRKDITSINQINTIGSVPTDKFTEIVNELFSIKYQEDFQYILLYSEYELINKISNEVKQILLKIYSSDVLTNPDFINLFNSTKNGIKKTYQNNYRELNNAWEQFSKIKQKNSYELYLNNFRKHCCFTNNTAFHSCKLKDGSNSEAKLITLRQDFKIAYVICTECKKCYPSDIIYLYCSHCKIEYASSLLKENESKNFELATLANYHCQKIVNEKLKCKKCGEYLYLNLDKKILQCKNEKCKDSFSAFGLSNICDICKQEFVSDAIIFNPVELKIIKKRMNLALIVKSKAHPNKVPCCYFQNTELCSTDFFHKRECTGILYTYNYDDKKMVLCSKCKAVNLFERFLWTCPKCGCRFKDQPSPQTFINDEHLTKSNMREEFMKNKVRATDRIKSVSFFDEHKFDEIRKNFEISKKPQPEYEAGIVTKVKELGKKTKENKLFGSLILKVIQNSENSNDRESMNMFFADPNEKIVSTDVLEFPNSNSDRFSSQEENDKKKRKSVPNYLSPDNKYNYNNNEKDIQNKIKKFKEKQCAQSSRNMLITEDLQIIKNYKGIETPSKKPYYSSYGVNNEGIRNNFNTTSNFNINDDNTKYKKRSLKTDIRQDNYSKNENEDIIKENKDNVQFFSSPFKKNKSFYEPIHQRSEEKLTLNNKENKEQNQENNNKSQDISPKCKVISGIPYNKNSLNNKSMISNLNYKKNFNSVTDKNNNFSFSNKSKSKDKSDLDNEDNNKETDNDKRFIRKKYSNSNDKSTKYNFKENNVDDTEDSSQSEDYQNKSNNNSKYNRYNRNRTNGNNIKDEKETENKEDIKKDYRKNYKTENNEEDNTKEEKERKGFYKFRNTSETKKENERDKEKDKDDKKNDKGKSIIEKSNIKERNNGKNHQNSNNEEKSSYDQDSNDKGNAKKKHIEKIENKKEKEKIENNNNNDKEEYKGNMYKNYRKYSKDNDKNSKDNEKKEEDKNKKTEEKNKEINKNNNKNKGDKEKNNQEKNKKDKSEEENKGEIKLDPEEEKEHKKIKKKIDRLLESSGVPIFEMGEYKIIKQLGNGTYATIYLVEHRKTKEHFALKKIMADNIDDAEAYHREIELLSSYSHPNVIKIHGVSIKSLDVTTIVLYVLMDIAKTDWDFEIKQKLSRRKKYKEEELVNILKQLTSALSYLQKNKISHRDIKPPNVLVFDENTYKLADFGEAKQCKRAKQVSTLRGTELYMSPLLYEGMQVDKENISHNTFKSDVFSLGYSFIYAANLDFNIIHEIRNIKDMNELGKILHDKFKGKYSEKFIDLLLKMAEVDESKRMDFISLEKEVNRLYPEEEEE